MEVLLSVVTITYNHAPYIAKCIEGVLMQQVNFPMEFIIAEDCSTDDTRTVCEEYAERCPELIRLLPSERNLGTVDNERRAIAAAKGKYVAVCEGDDYWTDPLKLQRQVNFLESHPDYSVCFHRYRKHFEVDNHIEDVDTDLFADGGESRELSMYDAMHRWQTQYLSMVFRRECYDLDLPDHYQYFRDTHQIYHLMLRGRCQLFSFYGGVYNVTGTGIYSDMDALRQEQMTLYVDQELWKVNNDCRWKEMCAIVMQDMIDRFSSTVENRRLLMNYAWRVFCHNHRVKKLAKNIIRIL